MTVTISATEARVRFGEVMRRAGTGGEAIVVERGGEPTIVVLSMTEYRRLLAAAGDETWRPGLDRAIQTAQRIRVRRGGAPMTAAEDILAQQREARDDELLGMR
jgi:prevent-host-death family protein